MLNKEVILKAILFGFVGLTGIAVDFAITILCKEYLDFNKYAANICGFAVAATSNYYLNRKVVFKSNNPQIAKEYLSFIVIASLGLVLNNIIIWFFTDHLEFLNFYIAKFVAIVLVFFWNFSLNFLLNFKSK